MLLGDLRAMTHGDHGVIASVASAMLWLEKNNVTFRGHIFTVSVSGHSKGRVCKSKCRQL